MGPNYSSETSAAEDRAIRRLCEAADCVSPFDAMVTRSRMLLAEHGQLSPPFNPEQMARLQGISRIDRTDITFDACLLPTPEGFRVEVCKYHGRGRQSFSVAHEIGHTFLIELEPVLGGARREVNIFAPSAANSNLVERLCDAAAAELIWPTHIFERDSWNAGPSLKAAVGLAQCYNASITATARRIAEIGPWRCQFIIWEAESDTGCGLKLRARSVYRSRYAPSFSKDEILVNEGSQFYRALECGHIVKGRETLDSTGRNVYAESMKLGRGVVSVVISEPHAELLAAKQTRPLQTTLFR